MKVGSASHYEHMQETELWDSLLDEFSRVEVKATTKLSTKNWTIKQIQVLQANRSVLDYNSSPNEYAVA